MIISRFRQSASLTLCTLIGVMAMVMIVGTALITISTWRHYSMNERTVRFVAADKAVFEALSIGRAHRGEAQTLLMTKPEPADEINRLKQSVQQKLDEALSALAPIDLRDMPQLLDKARTSWTSAAQHYDDLLQESAKPLEKRSLARTKAWNDALEVFEKALGAVSETIAGEVRLTDPVTAELQQFKANGWILRTKYGAQCSLGRPNVSMNTPLSTSTALQLGELRGGVNGSLERLHMLAERHGLSDQVVRSIAEADQGVSVATKWMDGVFARLDGSGMPAVPAEEWTKQCNGPYRSILRIVDTALDETTAHANAQRADAASDLERQTGLLLLMSAGGSFGFFLTRRRISSPVKQLMSAVERLTNRDFNTPVLALRYEDEFGKLSAALERLRLTSQEAADLLRRNATQAEQLNQAAELARYEEERIKAAAAYKAERIKAAEALNHSVQAIASGLEQLSSGNLTFRINQAFALDYAKLKDDFNAVMSELQETIKVISGTTDSLHSGVGDISRAAGDLSLRTERQAESLAETAAALNDITTRVNQTAAGAREADEVVSNAKADATHSVKVVRDAVEAMGGIQKSAQQISQIIVVINEISFQTNLLALNAGVEAARAGDSGSGFAVVANEVRALARRSAEAAKEIKTLISASTAQVNEGVTLVGETGNALERIVNQIGQIDSVVSKIAVSANEQATGLQQVNVAIGQIDEMTQQNAAMVEESTAATHSLAQEATQLADLIARFKVGSDEASWRPAIRAP
jgi:methyl-accepting chemotaxis protein